MRRIQILCLISFGFIFGCGDKESMTSDVEQEELNNVERPSQYLTVLGIAQDAGYPQLNCEKECCAAYYDSKEDKKLVSCLGLVDTEQNEKYIFDATPDFTEQAEELKKNHLDNGKVVDGIFLTHAHIGHYTGLMYLGFEALGGDNIPVYAMPRMSEYLTTNGPWSQLVSFNNIELNALKNDSTISLNSGLKVTPILVPHRDEFSETVGYKIEGKSKSALFIPDIDKWEKWDRDIIEEVKKVDYAFLDASFFRDGELNRDMSKIPHPFTSETTTLFEFEDLQTKNKIYFIHFNHTNPTIKFKSREKDSIKALGFNFSEQGMVIPLD